MIQSWFKLRCSARGRALFMRQKSTHYDSQSGKYFQLSDKVQLHVLQPSSHSNLVVGDNMKSFLQQQQVNLNIIDVVAANSDSQSNAMKELANLKSPIPTRCYIRDAFSVDKYTLQTVAANMCDAGCSQVILTDNESVLRGLDEYDLVEALEAVLWNDVVGEPMSMRLGLRLTSTGENWEMHIVAALKLNVKQFDVSLDGEGAPTLRSMLRILNDRSIVHNMDKHLE